MHQEWLGESSEAMGILRVSSRKQRDNISHETQEKEIVEYCAQNGLKLVKVESIVESAKDSESRKKYSAAMAHALTAGIRHILFYMYDREARNLTDNERNEKLVKAGIVVLHYVRDRKVLHKNSSDSEFFIRDVQAAANKQYSRGLSAKINDAMRQKAESGWFPSNHVPLGYIVRRQKSESGQEKRGTAIVMRDPDERKVKWVQMEFDLRAQGYSYPEIRETLAKSGLLKPEEVEKYFHGAIEYRIKNPFYEGYFRWQGIQYKGNHELIIPLKTLKDARASSGEKKKLNSGMESGIFGRGWMRCAECDCLITYDPKKNKYRNGNVGVFHYYRCANGKRFHKKNIYVSEAKIWEQFERVIEKISLTPEIAKRIADALNVTERKSAQEALNQVNKLEDSIKAIDQKEDRAYDDRLAGVLDEATFKRQRDRLRSERTRLGAELERAKAVIHGNFRENVSSIIELATDAKSLFLSRTPREKRDFLEIVLSNPRLRGSTVEYDLKSIWRKLVFMQSDVEVVVPSGNLSNFLTISKRGSDDESR